MSSVDSFGIVLSVLSTVLNLSTVKVLLLASAFSARFEISSRLLCRRRDSFWITHNLPMSTLFNDLESQIFTHRLSLESHCSTDSLLSCGFRDLLTDLDSLF
jgi:hypothetical protein